MTKQPLFPREVTGKLPRITLTGNELLHLEQHMGLAAYQPDMMLFRTSAGLLEITGYDLRFQSYSAAEAVITGEITGMKLMGAGGGR